MKIYVVIDTENRNDKVNGIMGVWTNFQSAREQASMLRSYRMTDSIKIVTYKKFGEAGFWFEHLFTEPMPKPF